MTVKSVYYEGIGSVQFEFDIEDHTRFLGYKVTVHDMKHHRYETYSFDTDEHDKALKFFEANAVEFEIRANKKKDGGQK